VTQAPVRRPYAYGECTHCHRRVALTVDNVVRRHGRHQVTCPGSWETPLRVEESSESLPG
jgi:hypothetical protein